MGVQKSQSTVLGANSGWRGTNRKAEEAKTEEAVCARTDRTEEGVHLEKPKFRSLSECWTNGNTKHRSDW